MTTTKKPTPVSTAGLRYDSALEDLQHWVATLLLVQLQRSGLGRDGTPEQASAQRPAGIVAKYERWWHECWHFLAARGLLRLEGGRVQALAADPEATWRAWAEHKAVFLNDPMLAVYVRLIDACLHKLPEILSGTVQATAVLFPDGNVDQVEGLYKNNAVADYFNSLVADVVEAYVKQRLERDPRATVRLIEIGAGTGGTSALLFARLQPYAAHLDYTYTDISRAFLLFAAEQYGPHCPYLQYKLWDVARPPAEQGIDSGAYDMAIATNVLHATRNIRQTLRHTKAALKHNGLLVLNEVTQKSILATLTLGLTDGWWLYEDESLRIPGSPLLDVRTWRDVLGEEGFHHIHCSSVTPEVGQQVMVAASDGMIRQKLPGAPLSTAGQAVASPPAAVAVAHQTIPATMETGAGKSLDELVTDTILTCLSQTLKIARTNIDHDVPFADYGVDSILGTSFVRKAGEALGLTLNTAILFDYHTVERLVSHVVATHRDHIASTLLARVATQQPMPVAAEAGPPAILTTPASTPERAPAPAILSVAAVSPVATDIAVIGMAGQFPGATNVDLFWQNLIEGRDVIGTLPTHYDDHLDADGKTGYGWGGFLAERDCFDPLFFNTSPREAESMSPHQRLILQESWKSLEDAGYDLKSLAGTRVGTFIGAEPCGYAYQSFTGASEAIIAARLSYLFDLKGPAMVINTACSSSGVAIHLACESLRHGESSLALAGGVFATLAQSTLDGLATIGMLSPDGRCSAFDAAANGTVLAEGVGVVVLKRLQDAIADGDAIYGVICASGVNQDGASNGITAPNGLAQEELITSVYTRYGIHPEQISYIEAHGTGTRLGDPVEANALVRAFRHFTDKQHYCAVGSAKAHIGHTAASAGVIGLIKILLSLRHRRLPALLHFQELNPAIAFDGSAFHINRQPMDWRSDNGMPLMAGLNSFGHSGTNVHLVVREYLEPSRSSGATSSQEPVCIPLSAHTAEALKTSAHNLSLFLQPAGAPQPVAVNLTDLAYTLQVGREAMQERVAFVVTDLSALVAALNAFSNSNSSGSAGRSDMDNCWQGRLDMGRDTLNPLAADEDAQAMLASWISKGKLAKIAQLWSRGFPMDWHLLYGTDRPRRLHLPTYPFARGRYWAPLAGATERQSAIHPLLHRNTSDLDELRFSSTLTGREFFLADHRVNGDKVLPGVAYLEMARVAVQQAAGLPAEGQHLHLKNIVWARRITVDNVALEVHISLLTEEQSARLDATALSYEIYTRPTAGASADIVLHGQGMAMAVASTEQPGLALSDLQAIMHRGLLSAEQCYTAFQAMGLDFGPAHQGITEIYQGDDQVLAQLRLPSCIADTGDQYVLHPSLMDAALQASLGLILQQDADVATNLGLPFTLEELDIFGPCTATMWVLIRYASGHAAADKIRKLDLDLCDETGKVRVRMRGFSSRTLESEAATSPAGATGTLLLQPHWRPQVAAGPVRHMPRQLVVFCELEQCFPMVSDPYLEGVSCLYWHAEAEAIDQRFQHYAAQLLEEVRRIILQKPPETVLVRVVTASPLFSGLAGLLQTLTLEHPKIVGQLLLIEPGETVPGIVARLRENDRALGEPLVRYEQGQRLVAAWQDLPLPTGPPAWPWKEKGVYLITGGAGGLGRLLAAEIAARARDVTIILVGRSPWSAAIDLSALRATGANVVYRQVDVSQKQDVAALVQHIRDAYGQLHGIVHSAGIIRDNFITHKTGEELRAVLAPKVAGLVNLDLATRDMQLDFLIAFASAAGAMGNPGQADYAAANAFMDAYAEMRNGLVAAGLCQGHTLSINWPLWQEGGMQVDEATARLMEQNTGAMAMGTGAGIQALYRALASGQSRVLVLAGRLSTLRRKVLGRNEPAPLRAAAPDVPGDLLPKIAAALLHNVADALKLRLEDVDLETDLSEYGFDSISLTEFANVLNRAYGLELVPTVFFEHANLAGLARYLHAEHQAVLAAHFQTRSREGSSHDAAPQQPRHRRSFRPARFHTVLPAAMPGGPEPVAVIGMSGRFPMAADLQQFWRNLQEGKDCIRDVPQERWDWRAFYGDPQKERNKTNIKWGGFIDGVGDFDPLFFGISPREAECMDPQQRLLMMYLWTAMEDAGYAPHDLSGTDTGIFVGTASGGYGSLIAQAGLPMESYIATGLTPSVGPNRMSFFLNLHGPSEPVETSCSSSLVAIHRAVLAIQDGSCTMAFAGGVNTIVSPEGTISLNKAGMLCEDGRCKTFSAAANGYVRAEGVGILLLKQLTAAQAAGDHIYGVIRASAENHGGRATSLTAPNPKAQAELLKTAWRKARIDPASLSYIEMHGTGTELGDPIEINGVKMAFQDWAATPSTASLPASCGLGSVKSNIGHAELASGVAGVIKVLLQLQHKTLVKSLHCRPRNPYIQLEGSPLYIVEETQPWVAPHDASGQALPRRAAVSSFGFGGVNAHVVIEEYVPEPPRAPRQASSAQPAVILLSARNEARLREYAANLRDWVRGAGPRHMVGVPQPSTQQPVSAEKIGAMLAQILSVQAADLDLEQDVRRDYGVETPHLASLAAMLRAEDGMGIDVRELLEQHSIRSIAACVREQYSRSGGSGGSETAGGRDTDLFDLAYTLQVGREAMEERLGFVAYSLEELAEKLQAFLASDISAGLYRGQVKSIRGGLATFAADADLAGRLDACFSQGQYEKLLDLWVKGLVVDWTRLYGAVQPRRISLPTYPFARERYWVSAAGPHTAADHLQDSRPQQGGDLPGEPPLAGASAEHPVGILKLLPVWNPETEAQLEQTRIAPWPLSRDRVAIVGALTACREALQQVLPGAHFLPLQPAHSVDEIARQLAALGHMDHIVWMAPQSPLSTVVEDRIIDDQEAGVLLLFRALKAMLTLGYGSRDLGWTVITLRTQPIHRHDAVNPTHASLHGLIGSMAKEYAHWQVRLLDIEDLADLDWQRLFTLPPDPRGNVRVYRDKQWHRQQLLPLHDLLIDHASSEVYRPGGVYVVIGGAGGVGEVWSEFMIRTWQAQIIWIGRRPKDDVIQAKLERLATLGPAPLYITADATDREALQRAYDQIKQHFAQVHGVVHAALVFSGGGLVALEEERLRAILASKVQVSVRLAQVFQQESPDFVLFFSSINAFLKAPGSSGYASACTFKDAFAQHLSQVCPTSVIKVINWGYWGSIGTAATSAAFQQWLAQSGLGSMEPAAAMAVLAQFLAAPMQQMALTSVTGPAGVQDMMVDWSEGVAVQRQELAPPARKLRSHAWQSAVQAGVRSHLGAPLQRLQARLERHLAPMDDLLARLLHSQLQRLDGSLALPATAASRRAFQAASGVLDAYDRWLNAAWSFVADRGHHNAAQGETAWQEWELGKTVWLQDPDRAAQVMLVDRTLRALPDILTGKCSATEVIFPQASLALVEGIYKHNPVADFFNEVLADTVIACLQEWRQRRQNSPGGRRIVEIGAGTGGSSATIFHKLHSGQPPYREDIAEYCYSDISRAFLLHAEREYAPDNPYLTCQIFNVEAPLAGQSLAVGAYDLVIAANVLHATRDIRQTLRNAKALLKNNGLLLLNEMACNTLFAHLTFGLLEGWWLYEDAELRLPGCPALSAPGWRKVLEQEGFHSVIWPAQAAHDLGFQIIVAESDGIVRQQLQPAAIPAAPRAIGSAASAAQRGTPMASTTGSVRGQSALRQKTLAYLTHMVGETLKIPVPRLDVSQPLEKYGIDSILVVQMTNALREVLDEVSSTLFFEHHTIEALADHFINTQRERLMALVGLEEQVVIQDRPEPVVPAAPCSEPVLQTSPRHHGAPPALSTSEDIAVIGMSGRFPQCHNVEEFWELLVSGRSAISRVPADRWSTTRQDEWGGFVPEMQFFDPLFFEISPRDATLMDPRQRLFLEEAWHTLEDAGYMGDRIRGTRCGVYVGVEEGEYSGLGDGNGQVTNNQNAMLPARIAYLLDLKGPNFALTAACSSGLVAIHQACQALRQGDCDLALAGGVNLIMSPLMYTALGNLHLLSPDGHCYAFDQRANGMVIGEAVAAVLLKPLARAIADGDRIYGCIKASGVNYDGRSNGITVPDPTSQAELIKDTYKRYGIDPSRIQYVMAHSVGSQLGDPVEFQALHKAFRAYTAAPGFCSIGSIKPLIGHTAAASGVVGLIAMLLAMHYKTIPATHNYVCANADITFANSPFVLHTENMAWDTPAHQPRLGTVSTAGISGTNAHVVIEEYVPAVPPQPPHHLAPGPRLIVLSARTPERLQAVALQLWQYIQLHGDLSLADLAYTLQVGRDAMASRLAMVVRNLDELVRGLQHYLAHGRQERSVSEADWPLPLFTGNLDAERSDMALLLSGNAGEGLLQGLLAEKNLEKLALYWAKGGAIPWPELHADGPCRLLALPTYPFARERYWVQASPAPQPDDAPSSEVAAAPWSASHAAAVVASSSSGFVVHPEQSVRDNIQRYIVWFLCAEIGLTPDQVQTGKGLRSYGVDSITSARLMHGFENIFHIRVTGRDMLAHKTIGSLITYLAGKGEVMDTPPPPAPSACGHESQSTKEYMDERVIEALERMQQGALDLEAVQRLISGSAPA